MNQANNALRQLRQACKGDPGCMQYSNQAEKLLKQVQDQLAMQQRYQQQNMVNQTRTQLLAQQQNLMNQLIKQQQFLQQQLASSKTPELKTINPFGDYRQHGVSLHPEDGRLHGPGTIADTPELSGLFRQPDMNAKEGPGMEAWKEAMRQLDSISSASSSFPTPSTAPSKTPKDKGSWDNPFANDPNVVDLSDSKTPTPKLLREDDSKQFGYPLNVDESSIEPYSAMSDERLEKKREALTKALEETQKISANNVSGYSQVEADATAGKAHAWQLLQDSLTTGALGVTQYISDKNDIRKLFNAVNTDPGPEKINAMRQSATAIKLDGDVEKAANVVDVDAFTDSANKGELGEAIGEGAMMLGGVLIKSPSRFNPTPLAAIPGVAKLASDEVILGTDYYVQSKEYKRQEELRKQLEANRLKLSNQLKEVIEEQNRRKSANPQ